MYISKPDNFWVNIYSLEEDVLGISRVDLCYEKRSHNFIKINRKDIIIGLSLPSQIEPRWLRDKEAMEKQAKQKGVVLKTEIADTTLELQTKQVENLISQDIDVLILSPTDSTGTAPLVDMAKNKGIKVIAYDRLIANSDIDLFVSTDNIRVGELQGRYLVGNVPKGTYIIMSGDPNDDNSVIFKEGAMEFIRPLVFNRDIKIVAEQSITNWDPKNAYDITKKALIATNNKIDAILAPNDSTAGGAIKALEEQGLAGKIPITGQDADLPAIKRILAGTQSMTVLKDTRELGKIAIDSAIKLASNQTLDTNSTVNNGKKIVPAILILPIFVNKENIEETIIKSGYWTKDQIQRS